MKNNDIGFSPHRLLYHTKHSVLILSFAIAIFLEASLYPYEIKTSIIRSLIDSIILVLFFAFNFWNSGALRAQSDRVSIFIKAMIIVNVYKIPVLALVYYFGMDPTDPINLTIFILYEICVHVLVYSVLSRQQTTFQNVVSIYVAAKMIAYLLKPEQISFDN